MNKILFHITDWMGWALVELSVRIAVDNEEDFDTLQDKVSDLLYRKGCALYGAFDNK
tara:strand:- start:90 stop:260 length:171 start_codon:yes stop_codon:yes gene_type:complete